MVRVWTGGLLSADSLVSLTQSTIAQEILLDGIVVTSSKTEESAIDALSGSSAISRQEIDTQFQPEKISQVLRTMPGVTTQETACDTPTAINTAARKHAEAYTALDLFAEYHATDQFTINANIDNVFDEIYRQHLDQYNSPGFNARIGLTMRLGAQ